MTGTRDGTPGGVAAAGTRLTAADNSGSNGTLGSRVGMNHRGGGGGPAG